MPALTHSSNGGRGYQEGATRSSMSDLFTWTLTHWWMSHWEQFGVKYLAQGLFDMQSESHQHSNSVDGRLYLLSHSHRSGLSNLFRQAVVMTHTGSFRTYKHQTWYQPFIKQTKTVNALTPKLPKKQRIAEHSDCNVINESITTTVLTENSNRNTFQVLPNAAQTCLASTAVVPKCWLHQVERGNGGSSI